MARTLDGDDGVTDANGDDDNEGIMRSVSGSGCGKQAPHFHGENWLF